MAAKGARAKTPRAALAFVRRHGAVLLSGRGAAPSLADWVAGEAIAGSWWGHARGHEIYALASALEKSPDVLVCRAVGGKRTLVHRRLWPALVRAAAEFPRAHLARVVEEHTARGRHDVREMAFPRWAPPDVRAAAKALALDEA
ncbi:MAG TPA: hypothetical protein VFT98_01650, partial [Myxococcota bacterium]|nr:hypothetical protein [Myxococcota bacterium]